MLRSLIFSVVSVMATATLFGQDFRTDYVRKGCEQAKLHLDSLILADSTFYKKADKLTAEEKKWKADSLQAILESYPDSLVLTPNQVENWQRCMYYKYGMRAYPQAGSPTITMGELRETERDAEDRRNRFKELMKTRIRGVTGVKGYGDDK